MSNAPLDPWSDQRTPALAIVARGDQIRAKGPTRFLVNSQSRPGRVYSVSIQRDRWRCSCAFHRAFRGPCIHIRAVQFLNRLGEPTDDHRSTRECPNCGAARIIGFGRRYNQRGVVQRYRCTACGHRFTETPGALGLRHDTRTVAIALDLFFRGLSLRKVSEHLEQAHNLRVAPSTVYGWVARFAPQAAKWMDSLSPESGDQWNIDETVVSVDGKPRWVWNILDATTRFLLAARSTKLRRTRDARALIRSAKRATPDRPASVLTDGLAGYRKAVSRELAFRSPNGLVSPHVRVPSIRANPSNNLVERLHGTEKDRIKVMRGFHGPRGLRIFVDGFRTHYNVVRRHSALPSTPAAASGLPDPGPFRWKGILEAAERKTFRPPGMVELVLVVSPKRKSGTIESSGPVSVPERRSEPG